jgi:hypothetical protein
MYLDPHTHLLITNQRLAAASTAASTGGRRSSRARPGVLRRLLDGLRVDLPGSGGARGRPVAQRRPTAPAPVRGGPAILAE